MKVRSGCYGWITGTGENGGAIVYVVRPIQSSKLQAERPGFWWHCVGQQSLSVQTAFGKTKRAPRGFDVVVHDDQLQRLYDGPAPDQMVLRAGKAPSSRSSNWPKQ